MPAFAHTEPPGQLVSTGVAHEAAPVDAPAPTAKVEGWIASESIPATKSVPVAVREKAPPGKAPAMPVKVGHGLARVQTVLVKEDAPRVKAQMVVENDQTPALKGEAVVAQAEAAPTPKAEAVVVEAETAPTPKAEAVVVRAETAPTPKAEAVVVKTETAPAVKAEAVVVKAKTAPTVKSEAVVVKAEVVPAVKAEGVVVKAETAPVVKPEAVVVKAEAPPVVKSEAVVVKTEAAPMVKAEAVVVKAESAPVVKGDPVVMKAETAPAVKTEVGAVKAGTAPAVKADAAPTVKAETVFVKAEAAPAVKAEAAIVKTDAPVVNDETRSMKTTAVTKDERLVDGSETPAETVTAPGLPTPPSMMATVATPVPRTVSIPAGTVERPATAQIVAEPVVQQQVRRANVSRHREMEAVHDPGATPEQSTAPEILRRRPATAPPSRVVPRASEQVVAPTLGSAPTVPISVASVSSPARGASPECSPPEVVSVPGSRRVRAAVLELQHRSQTEGIAATVLSHLFIDTASRSDKERSRGNHPDESAPVRAAVVSPGASLERPVERAVIPEAVSSLVASDGQRERERPPVPVTAARETVPSNNAPTPEASRAHPPQPAPAATPWSDGALMPPPVVPPLPPGAARLAELVADDPSVYGAAMGKNAHVSLDTGKDGDLSLHMRVEDGVVDLRVDGQAAHTLDIRQQEVRSALAGEGISLGRFETSVAPDAPPLPASTASDADPAAGTPAGAGFSQTPSHSGSNFGGNGRHVAPDDPWADRDPRPAPRNTSPSAADASQPRRRGGLHVTA